MGLIHVFSSHHRTLSAPPPTPVPSTLLPIPSCPQLPALTSMHHDSLDNLSLVELEDNQIDRIPIPNDAPGPPSNDNAKPQFGKGIGGALSSVPTTAPTTAPSTNGMVETEGRSASPSSVSSIYSQDESHVDAAADKLVPSTEAHHTETPPDDEVSGSNAIIVPGQETLDAPLYQWLASTAPQGRPMRSNSKHIHYFETNGIKLRMKEHAGVLVEWVDGICLTMNLDEQLDPSRGAAMPDPHVEHPEKVPAPPSTWQRGAYKYRPLSSGASKYPPASSRPLSLSKIDEIPLANALSKEATKKQNIADDWGVPSSIERASLTDTVLEQFNDRSRPRATRHSSDYIMSGALSVPASSSATQPKDRPLSLQFLPSASTQDLRPLRVSTDPRTMSTPDLPSSKKPVYEMAGSPVSPISTSTVPLSAQPDGFEMRPLSPLVASPPQESSRALQVLRKFEHKPKFQDFVSRSKDKEATTPASNTTQASPPASARPQSQILSAFRGTISHSLFEQSNPSKTSLPSRSEPKHVASPDLLPSPTQIRRMAQFENPIYPSLSTSEIADLPHPPRPPRQMIPVTHPSRRPRSSTHAPLPRSKGPVKPPARSRPPTPPNSITELALKHQPEKHLANIPAPNMSLVSLVSLASGYTHVATPSSSSRPPASSDRKRLTKPRPSKGHHRQVRSLDSPQVSSTASTESSSTMANKASVPYHDHPGYTDVERSPVNQNSNGSATVSTNAEDEPTHKETFCACTDPEPTTMASSSATPPDPSAPSTAADGEPEPFVHEQGHVTTTNSYSTSRMSSPARRQGRSRDTLTNATFHEVTTSTLAVPTASDETTPTNVPDDVQSHSAIHSGVEAPASTSDTQSPWYDIAPAIHEVTPSTTFHGAVPVSKPIMTVKRRPSRLTASSRRTSYHDVTTASDIVSPSSRSYYSTTRDQKYDEDSSNASYYALVTAKPHSSAIAVADMLRAGSMRGGGSLRGRSLSAGRSAKVANVNVNVAERMAW